jgi:hypothetical protein
MNSILLYEENYTLWSAVSWGIWREHLERFRYTKWSGKGVWNLTFVILELIPVISQIISLFEYIIRKILLPFFPSRRVLFGRRIF